MTGARLKRVEKYVDGDCFMLTYGDGVTGLSISDLVAFHKSRDKIGTVTAVSPPSTFGELKVEGDLVVRFHEKPESGEMLINGGFFVFQREFFKYLSEDESCILEREPLERLVADGQLAVHRYSGYWRCMDTYRDMLDLNEQWEGGHAGWKVWA
jgi:glucose-1-phosphate cytidylyltransferase